MFENKLTHNGIHYSRYIASWRKMGGKIYRGGLFEKWLIEEGLTEDEISDILNLAENGKMELEMSAQIFIIQHKEDSNEERKLAMLGEERSWCRECKMHIETIKLRLKRHF